ncbi:MAG: CHAT domain-containing protein [Actinomycetota bacterium]
MDRVSVARQLVARADAEPEAVRTEALTLLPGTDESELDEAHALAAWALGLALRHLRDLDGATYWLDRALRSLDDGAEDHSRVALTLTGVMAFRGEFRNALATLDALEPTDALRGRIGFQRAAVLERLGEISNASVGYESALEEFHRNGDRLGAAHAQNGLGLIALERGSHAIAAARFGLARSIYAELDLPLLAAVARNNIGLAALRSGDVMHASELFDIASAELTDLGEPFGETALDHVEAMLLLGRPSAAAERASDALRQLQSSGVSSDRAELLVSLAVALHRDGQTGAASRAFDVADELFETQGRPAWRAVTRLRRLEADTITTPADLLATGDELVAHGLDDAALDAASAALDICDDTDIGCVDECRQRLASADDRDLRRRNARVVELTTRGDRRTACDEALTALEQIEMSMTAVAALDERVALLTQGSRIMRAGLRAAREIGDVRFVIDASHVLMSAALRPRNPITPSALGAAFRRCVDGTDREATWRRVLDAGESVTAPPTATNSPRPERRRYDATTQMTTIVDDGRTMVAVTSSEDGERFIDLPTRGWLIDAFEQHRALLTQQLGRPSTGGDRLLDESARTIRSRLPWLAGPDSELIVAVNGRLASAPWTSVAERPVRILADPRPARPPDERVVFLAGPGISTAHTERAELARLYGQRLINGGSGDPLALAMDAADATLHLCCHGHHDPINPILSSYELDVGDLDGATIASAASAPALVVAAACRSGSSSMLGDTGAVGLPLAWITAGTSTVIAPVCPIPDDERTVSTAIAVHRALAAGASPERAIRKALVDGDPTVARSLIVFGRVPHEDDPRAS